MLRYIDASYTKRLKRGNGHTRSRSSDFFTGVE